MSNLIFDSEPEQHHTPVNYSAVGLLGFLALLSLIQLSVHAQLIDSTKKADCNSALGLLGVLGLVSFLQNVLRQMSTTTASPNNGRRRKRSDQDQETTDRIDSVLSAPSSTNDNDHGYDQNNDLHRVTHLMLPLMTAVAHARDRFVPQYCTYREICSANSILAKEFGPQGRSLGATITEAVANMLTKDTKFDYKQKMENKIMRAAGKSGRNGSNCDDLFKKCPELQWLPTYSIPPSMLSNPSTFNLL